MAAHRSHAGSYCERETQHVLTADNVVSGELLRHVRDDALPVAVAVNGRPRPRERRHCRRAGETRLRACWLQRLYYES